VIQGDARQIPLRDRSVQCVVTSPPYWGLRDYGQPGQLGLEPTPEAYVAIMVAVFREVRRVLRDDGTLWLNMGDGFWNGGAEKRDGGHDFVDGGKPKLLAAKGALLQARSTTDLGLKPKDLIGMPWRLAFALQQDDWYLRSDIIWAKPNPMPESVTDRPTKAHEYLFLLSKRERYFYDAEAIREPLQTDPELLKARVMAAKKAGLHNGVPGDVARIDRYAATTEPYAPSARNRRTVWTIATEPYPEAHFATFPEDLVKPCVLAGTSEKGACAECGAPWERVLAPPVYQHINNSAPRAHSSYVSSHGIVANKSQATLGWRPTCAHDAPTVPCVVFDPFAGSGTTCYVATELGRVGVGLELKRAYINLARARTRQYVLSLNGAEPHEATQLTML